MELFEPRFGQEHSFLLLFRVNSNTLVYSQVNSREVFLAPDHNDNSVDKLISRAKLEVVKPGEASTQRGIEFCAREYDSIHQVVTPLSKAFTKYRKFLRGLGNPTPKPSSSASPTAAAAGAPSQDAGTLTTPAASDGPGAGQSLCSLHAHLRCVRCRPFFMLSTFFRACVPLLC